MPQTTADLATIALLEQTDGRSELYEGELREKPPMSIEHNESARELRWRLESQLDRRRFVVLYNDGHLAIPGGNSYIPDVAVLPRSIMNSVPPERRRLERYIDPLPFVAEVWSPSTGTYDIDAKIPGYRARGDAEIWRLHPFERMLAMWRLQPDGSYAETTVRGGSVRLHALPDVTVDLDGLFVGG